MTQHKGCDSKVPNFCVFSIKTFATILHSWHFLKVINLEIGALEVYFAKNCYSKQQGMSHTVWLTESQWLATFISLKARVPSCYMTHIKWVICKSVREVVSNCDCEISLFEVFIWCWRLIIKQQRHENAEIVFISQWLEVRVKKWPILVLKCFSESNFAVCNFKCFAGDKSECSSDKMFCVVQGRLTSFTNFICYETIVGSIIGTYIGVI